MDTHERRRATASRCRRAQVVALKVGGSSPLGHPRSERLGWCRRAAEGPAGPPIAIAHLSGRTNRHGTSSDRYGVSAVDSIFLLAASGEQPDAPPELSSAGAWGTPLGQIADARSGTSFVRRRATRAIDMARLSGSRSGRVLAVGSWVPAACTVASPLCSVSWPRSIIRLVRPMSGRRSMPTSSSETCGLHHRSRGRVVAAKTDASSVPAPEASSWTIGGVCRRRLFIQSG